MRLRKGYIFVFVVFAVTVLCSCSERRMLIGVSQCSDDEWRQKVNREIRIGQYKYKNVDVVICSADNDACRQVNQIDSLIGIGVDLLIVAPSDVRTVTPAIDKAYKAGVPVILFDRKIGSDNFTAYVGADNVEIGRIMVRFVSERLGGKGSVLEIGGLRGSTPVVERHKGFAEEIRRHPGISTKTVYSDWNVDGTRVLMSRLLDQGMRPDCVFGHNDAEALGAWEAARDKGVERGIIFVGIDGLPGERQGIDEVLEGHFAASYIYPTKGETLIPLAMKILSNEPYNRINILQSSLVTSENAAIVEMQNNEIQSQLGALDDIYANINTYMKMYRSQKIISWLAVLVVALLVILAAYNYYVYKTKARVGKRLRQIADEKVAFFTNASHQLRTPLTLVAGPLDQLLAKGGFDDEQKRLLDIVRRNVCQLTTLTDSVLNFRNTVDAMDQSDTKDDTVISETMLHAGHQQLLTRGNDELATVLVVDDNADIRSYLRSVLGSIYYVLEASDGKNGLQLARESVPDIIVSDVMMPLMDGLTFCRKIKEGEVTSHIPVVLLTARSEESQRIEGYEHGADAYITKPFNAALLIARIENLLAIRRSLAETIASRTERPAQADSATDTETLFIDRLRDTVSKRMGDVNLKMDDLADELRMSRVQLYRKVKALTGKSPSDILREMRLSRGHWLLTHTDHSISEIAGEVGYAVPSYFTACFKKQYGVNPTELRTV